MRSTRQSIKACKLFLSTIKISVQIKTLESFFKMAEIIWLVIIITLAKINLSNGNSIILGLNERLESFKICNTRITAQFSYIDWDYEHSSVPVTLRESFKDSYNLNWTLQLQYSMIDSVFNPSLGSMFKYRKNICRLELIVHPSSTTLYSANYSPLTYDEYHYNVFIWYHREFERKFYPSDWDFMLSTHAWIYVWTVRQQFFKNSRDIHLLFQDILFLCIECTELFTVEIHPLNVPSQVSDFKTEMHELAKEIRQQFYWIEPKPFKFSKACCRLNYPYDEVNIGQERGLDFYSYTISMLLKRSNSSMWRSINEFHLEEVSFSVNLVADEKEGFNFVTCHTSDTFWSIAALFWKPYQPEIWASIGITVLITLCLVFGIKILGKLTFSVTRLLTFIVFNLIEAGVRVSNLILNNTKFKILLATWLTMSVILTNSYKGLIIVYLSAPWTPAQDFNYFKEIQQFRIHSPVAAWKEMSFKEQCKDLQENPDLYKVNSSCNEYLNTHSIFGQQAGQFYQYENFSGLEQNVFDEFTNSIAAFLRSERHGVFRELANGGKVAIAGLNTEIDEILMEFKKDFKSVTLFRGKENLWSHNKHWSFKWLTYSRVQSKIELVRLINAGIYQFWKYWLRDRKYIVSELKLVDPPPEPLSLGSNVFFVFVILIIGLVTSALVSLLEVFINQIVMYVVKSKPSVELPLPERLQSAQSIARIGDTSIPCSYEPKTASTSCSEDSILSVIT